jgi:DnaJ-class molecular chaperone
MTGFSDFFRVFFGEEGAGAGGRGFGGFGGAGADDFVDLSGFGGVGDATRGSPRRLAPEARAEAEVTLAEVAKGAERMVNVDGRRLQVKIPAGVADGARIKLRGGGVRGGTEGEAGDLVITVRVKADPQFERRGADLHVEVPITLAEALLGGEVRVPTPTGSVKLRIRPNTQNGQEIRVRGRGLPKRGGEKGDLVVKTRVVLPTLDDKGRAELERILRDHPQPDPRR